MRGGDFDSSMILGFNSLLISHSSMFVPMGSIFGFLETSLKSNSSSKGVSPLGRTLYLSCSTLNSYFFGSLCISVFCTVLFTGNFSSWKAICSKSLCTSVLLSISLSKSMQ